VKKKQTTRQRRLAKPPAAKAKPSLLNEGVLESRGNPVKERKQRKGAV
jgi:hypothetical protein